MELSDSKIKKLISGNGTLHFLDQARKKITLKKFRIFQETETQKKFLVFSQKKAVLIFRETETSKIFFKFQKMGDPKTFFIFQEKKFCYISGNGSSKKTSYISGSNFLLSKTKKNPFLKSFLCFRKQNFLAPSLKKITSVWEVS